MIEIIIEGKPEPAGSKKAFPINGRCQVVDANDKVPEWKKHCAKSAVAVMGMDPPLEGPLKVEFYFQLTRPKTVKRTFPTVRPDTTKLVRGVEDALTGIVWKDDAQIVTQIAGKSYVTGPCVTRVYVSEYQEW